MRHLVSATALTVTAVAVAAGVLTGCSKSVSGRGATASAAQQSTSAPGSTSTSASAPAPASSTAAPSSSVPTGSAATLKGVLLRIGDLPPGWTPATHDSSGDSDSDQSLDKQLSGCIGVSIPPAAQSSDAGAVYSPDFNNGNNEITSQAKPARDVAAQRRFDRAVVASSKTDKCFEAVVRTEVAKSLPAAAKIDSVKVHVSGRTAGQPAGVEVNFAARIVLTVQGRTIATALDLVDILSTRIEAEVDFQSLGAPIPASTQRAAVAAVAARVAKA